MTFRKTTMKIQQSTFHIKNTISVLKSSKYVKSKNEWLHDVNLVDEPKKSKRSQMTSSDINCNYDAKCEVCGDQLNSFYHLFNTIISNIV